MRDLNRWIMTFWHNCIFLNVNAHDGPPSWKYHGAACGWLVNCGPPKPDTASPVSWFKGIVSELSGFSELTPLQSVTVEHHLIHDSTPRPRTPSHTHTNTHTLSGVAARQRQEEEYWEKPTVYRQAEKIERTSHMLWLALSLSSSPTWRTSRSNQNFQNKIVPHVIKALIVVGFMARNEDKCKRRFRFTIKNKKK